MYYNSNVVISREIVQGQPILQNTTEAVESTPFVHADQNGKAHTYVWVKSPVTTVPFFKEHELSYAKIASVFGKSAMGGLHRHFIYCS